MALSVYSASRDLLNDNDPQAQIFRPWWIKTRRINRRCLTLRLLELRKEYDAALGGICKNLTYFDQQGI